MFFRRVAVGGVGVFRRLEVPKIFSLAAKTNVGNPFAIGLVKRHALEAGRVVSVPADVASIFGLRRFPQI